MHTIDHEVFQFESFRLDLRRGCVFNGDREIELRPKSFEVLRYLVANAGRLVSKDELIGRVWPNVVVNEDSLARCVSEVRQVLGDETQRIIKTIPRRGYLFSALVSDGSTAAGPAAAAASAPSAAALATLDLPQVRPASSPILATNRRLRWILGASALLLLAAIAATVSWWQPSAGPALPDKPSIAVLPFKNLSGDPTQEYFSDGMTEDLITSLSKFSGLFVIARGSAFKYKNSPADQKQIGRELGVRYLVEGSIRRNDDQVRINARLVDTATGAHRWAESYDERTSGLFAMQDELARKITVTLVSHVTASELDRVLRKPPESMAAYDFFLRAKAELRNSFGQDRDRQLASLVEARQFLRQSLAADPRFASSMAALAGTYLRSWRQRLNDEYRQQATLDRALDYGRQAIELDPYMAEAHAQLAYILHWHYRRGDAMKEFERAFELNPNLVDGVYGLMLVHNGRSPEAIAFFKRAMRLDPLHPPDQFSFLGNAYFFTGQYDKSLEMHRIAASRLPGLPEVHVWHAAIAAQMDNMDEAKAATASVLRLDPDFTITAFLGLIRLAERKEENQLAAALRKAGLPA